MESKLRHRQKGSKVAHQRSRTSRKKASTSEDHGSLLSVDSSGRTHCSTNWSSVSYTFLGLAIMCFMGYQYSKLITTSHENRTWFSNITDLQKELTLHSESALYYSFYKKLVKAPSFTQGIQDLMHDKRIEHPSTINVLSRFNIYQEIVLAAVYRTVPSIQEMGPISFYISSIFTLHGLLLCLFYLLTWDLAGSWLVAFLASSMYIFNKYECTRVYFLIPLRENFSLPFWWGQLLCMNYFLSNREKLRKMSLFGVWICTFLVCLTWQFSQFLLLIQAFVLFILWLFDCVPSSKVKNVFGCHVVSMFLVYILQFGNKMLLGSFLNSFILCGFITMNLSKKYQPQTNDILISLSTKVTCLVLTMVSAIFLNMISKKLLNISEDEHIFRFLIYKLGIGNKRDFTNLLYDCGGSFGLIGSDTLLPLCYTLVLPFYIIGHVILLILLLQYAITNCKENKNQNTTASSSNTAYMDNSAISFHTVHMLLLGIIAIFVQRMKYLWVPQMIICAAVLLAEPRLWHAIYRILSKSKSSSTRVHHMRNGVLFIATALLSYFALVSIKKELSELKVYNDPYRDQLMKWINKNTDESAAFTGSMQLMSSVKLCTDRKIANHPHFEDKGIRERTFELYQIYHKKKPTEIFSLMEKYRVNYFVIENLLCLPVGSDCFLPALLEVSTQPSDHLTTSTPLFCDALLIGRPSYKKFFQLVFQNQMYRVYKIVRSTLK